MMEMAITEKCENGYIVRVGEKIHVLHGFDSHAALGKVIATALGIIEVKKMRKPRTKKAILTEMYDASREGSTYEATHL